MGSFSVLLTGGTVSLIRETESIEVSFWRHPLKGLRHPVRIVQLSDLHASSVVRWQLIEKSVQIALKQDPDIVVLTGDYSTGGIQDGSRLRKTLQPLSQKAACFACLGNHDGGIGQTADLQRETISLLREAGIEVLHNRGITARSGSNHISIVGTGDFQAGWFRPDHAFSQVEKTLPTLLLTHNPDAKFALFEYEWDFCFCGHTHGGQINLPFAYGKLAPVDDKSTIAGLFSFRNRHLYVNRGIGSLGGIRFRARPEVSVFDFHPSDENGVEPT